MEINGGNTDIDHLGARIVQLAGRLAAATCQWLLLIADFDARDGAPRFGLPTTAHWLAHTCGLAQRTAVERVRVARALRAHPALATQMSAGRLSYSHVRAISRVGASEDEHALVSDLIEIAQHGTAAHVEAMVRGLRTVDHNESGGAADAGEQVSRGWGEDSRWRLSARLDPERGAVVDAAIERIAAAEGITLSDALVRLAEFGLEALADGEKPAKVRRGQERAAVVIHLDAARVPAPADPERSAERDDPPRPYAHVENGPGLPDRVVQRLLCSGRIRTVLRDGEGSVLDVGRSRRLVTERQYKALLIRHRGRCAYPGCTNTRDLDGHHVIPWLEGGRTDMSNLILLCEPHHNALHDGEFSIFKRAKERFGFVRADGIPLHESVQLNADGDIGATDVAPHAATPRWDGQRLDHDYAVAVLAARRYREAG